MRAERLHLDELEARALCRADDEVERGQVGVGEDLLLDEPAVGALQPGDGASAVPRLADGVVEEEPAGLEVLGKDGEVAVQVLAPDVLHHSHRGNRVPALGGRELPVVLVADVGCGVGGEDGFHPRARHLELRRR